MNHMQPVKSIRTAEICLVFLQKYEKKQILLIRSLNKLISRIRANQTIFSLTNFIRKSNYHK
jgi:hypothetical protein